MKPLFTLLICIIALFSCNNEKDLPEIYVPVDGIWSGWEVFEPRGEAIDSLHLILIASEVEVEYSDDVAISAIGNYKGAKYNMDVQGFRVKDSVYLSYYEYMGEDCIGGLMRMQGVITDSTIQGELQYNFAFVFREGTFKLKRINLQLP
ncbi:MAG: hypothetical protein ACP5OA_03425 [Candidatus Woesearchaeota archaeon]